MIAANNSQVIQFQVDRTSHLGNKAYRGSYAEIILELLGSKCNRCGSKERLEIDHVVPVSIGGVHKFSNLQSQEEIEA